ncbi:MAG: hypothetical protein ACXVPU_16880 [Bacteroidia bacterium]
MKSFKSINLILLTLSVTEIPVIACTSFSIEEAAKKGMIKLSIKGKGGYTGDVIAMKIQNLTNKIIDLKLEAGRRLDSKKENEQDILVTQPQEFVLNANQNKTINIFGMCCQAHNSAPQPKSDYSVGKLADSNLIKLATFIDKNKYYTNYSAQQSVWVLSDNNSIASICSGDKETVTSLRKFVSKLTGKIIPPYDITYKEGIDGSAMGRAIKIEGVFEYSLPMSCHSTMGIYDEAGRLIQMIFKDLQSDRGEYKLFYTFRTKDIPPGTYYARVDADGMLQKQIKIEF